MKRLLEGAKRRLKRSGRRRAVGRAYDMALEIARVIPRGASILDVGCGNGFIAHHLTGMLRTKVVGLDVAKETEASIPYVSYNGRHFPVKDQSFDVILLCYVLHHAQDFCLIMNEVKRVLREGGLVVVYEDIPFGQLDRFVCGIHDRKWRDRTGPCTFQLAAGWRALFFLSGFEIVNERPLSRWRNLGHPVSRRFFLLRANEAPVNQAERAYLHIEVKVGLKLPQSAGTTS